MNVWLIAALGLLVGVRLDALVALQCASVFARCAY